jgi:hypothetical protein
VVGWLKRVLLGSVLIAFLGTVLTAVGVTSDAATSTVPVQRIYGTDAIGTSIAVSQAEFPTAGSATAVVLARSDFFADALAGGPLAAQLGGPLLITPRASLRTTIDPQVQAEIQRVLPVGDTVYILGGDLALSPGIDTQLQALGYVTQRIAGADDYGTAVDIAEALGNPTTIFEATALSFQDALSAVPAAIEEHGAILLTDGTTQAPETAAYLSANTRDTRYAIGGRLAAYGADPTAIPVYGQDLYGTSAAVASMFFPSATVFGAATGADFADALSGGVLMGEPGTQGPMLLVPSSGPLPPTIDTYLTGVLPAVTQGYLFGGPLAVGSDVLTELKNPQTTTATTAPSTTATTQPPSGGDCTSPIFSASDAEGTENIDGGAEYWWVNNDAWSGSSGPQTIYVCNQSSWYAVSNQPNDGGQVETYPDTEYDVGGRNTPSTTPISGWGSITSAFSEAYPSAGGWDAAYDLWLNNWSTEIMIWNQWAGSQSYWPDQATISLTLDGVGYAFYDNGGELMFFRDTQVSSGSVDILAAFNWLVANGYVQSTDVPTQLEYGVEICYTDGSETFPMTGLTFHLS